MNHHLFTESLREQFPNLLSDNPNELECKQCHSKITLKKLATAVELFDSCKSICINCIDESDFPLYLASSRAIRRTSINDAREVADYYKGQLTSQTYSSTSDKLTWKCENGHSFKRSLISIKINGSFCIRCHGYLGEEIVRSIFELMTGFSFNKERNISFFANEERGSNLELDGFNQKLMLAFEHQGSQHYGQSRRFNDDEVLERDVIKKRLCEKHGIDLIEVPSVTEGFGVDNAILLIKEELEKLGHQTKPVSKADIFPIHAENQIEKMGTLASSLEGHFVSKIFLGMQEKHLWKCKNGHIFEARPYNVKQGWWCRKCSTPSYSIEDLRSHAKRNRGYCLTTKYKNKHSKYQWKCSKGHKWKSNWHSVQGGSWCPECSGHKKFTLEDLQLYASERKGRCLSKEYKNAHSKIEWECENKHQWKSSWHNERKKDWCRKCRISNSHSVK